MKQKSDDKKILKKINKPRTGKHILKSKTFWVNIIMVLLIPLAPPQLKVYLSQPDVVVTMIGLVNLLLRLFSSDKVYLK